MTDPHTAYTSALSTTLTLLSRLSSTLSSPSNIPPIPTSSTTNLNAIRSASTSLTILNAQLTKLSLLALTPPYTPSAITPILTSLHNSCIPAMGYSCQLCYSPGYTRFLAGEVRLKLLGAMKSLESLLVVLPKVGADHGEVRKEEDGYRDKILKSTGQVMEFTKEMDVISTSGLTKLATSYASNWSDLVSDAVSELEEWLQTSDEDADEKEDDIFGASSSHCPPNLKPLATKSLELCKAIKLLYPPIKKRRIARFPNVTSETSVDSLPSPEICERFDKLLDSCKHLSEKVDEVAEALYEAETEDDDEEEDDDEAEYSDSADANGKANTEVETKNENLVRKRMRELKALSKEVLDAVRLNWEGQEDEFTTWSGKWMVKLDEIDV